MQAINSAEGPEVENNQPPAQIGEADRVRVDPFQIWRELRCSYHAGVRVHAAILMFSRPTLGKRDLGSVSRRRRHSQQGIDGVLPVQPLPPDALTVAHYKPPVDIGVQRGQLHAQHPARFLGRVILFALNRNH